MRYIILLSVFLGFLNANIIDIPTEVKIEGEFANNKRCVRCHLDIYLEFKGSRHNLSNTLTNPMHKAMFEANPLSEKGQYKCAECHAPTAKNIEAIMNGEAELDGSDKSHTEGISCAMCHRIKSISKHGNKYKYDLTKKKIKFFGNRKQEWPSDLHEVVTTNPEYKLGNICLSCHSQHSRNKQLVLKKSGGKDVGYCVYSTLEEPNQSTVNTEKKNCITCHMPQVDGSLTDRIETHTHAYHGFPAVSSGLEMVRKYVDLNVSRTDNGFDVVIANHVPHDMLLHPLRTLILEVKVHSGTQTKKFDDVLFQKESTDIDAEPLEWLEEKIVDKNTIKADETKSISYAYVVKAGDRYEIALYYTVMPENVAKRVGFKDKQVLLRKLFKQIEGEL